MYKRYIIRGNWFSGINYGLYGYIGIEYIFTLLQRRKRDLINVVAGAVMLGLIYFAMCFNGGISSIGFEWYHYDLLHNLAHASGFVAGLVLGIVEQGTNGSAAAEERARNNKITAIKKALPKFSAKPFAVNSVDYALFSERNAFSTTLSAVKPNISNSLFAGPEAPKVVMPMISPQSPAYLYQE